MQRTSLAGYLSFSKKERTGIIVLLALIGVLVFIPFLFPLFIKDKKVDATAFSKEIAALTIKQQEDSNSNFSLQRYNDNNYNNYDQPARKNYLIKGTLFYFDPNTITAAEWKRLGVRDKTVATIQNYIAKGGRFYKPADLEKIWGFFPEEVERLEPYVQIQQTIQQYPDKKFTATKMVDKPIRNNIITDINIADTTAFIALPGIGSKLALRIISFRDKLGGFYRTEQVAETFGLADSTFQKIRPYLQLGDKPIKQFNINTATTDELKQHPYIRWNIANAIVQYRTQHGNFSTVDQLKNIMLIDESIFNKIMPYVKLH